MIRSRALIRRFFHGAVGLDGGCLAAGMALPLAFAPWDYYWLSWIVLIPLLQTTEHPRAGVRFRRGLLFGLGLFGLGLHWLLPTIDTFGNMPTSLALLVWALLVAYCALYPALFGLFGGYLVNRPGWRYALLLPVLWAGLEGVRGFAFTGFPWLTLGISQLHGPLSSLLPIIGATGASVAAVALNGTILLGVRAGLRGEPHRRVVAPLTAALLGLASAGLLSSVEWTHPVGKPLEAALVQGAIPQHRKWEPAARQSILAHYRRLSRAHLGSDLVIWPESALPLLADQAQGYLDQLDREARTQGTVLLIGLPERIEQAGRWRYYNSVWALGAGEGGVYRKRHLVPFGEYVPMASLLSFAERFVPGQGAFSAGESAAPLKLAGSQLGLSICYEDAFPWAIAATVRQGAELLVNVTNDAWFGRSLGRHQHAQLARLRAREMGRPMLRVANTGLTFATDHRGQAIARISPDRPGVARVRVQPRQGRTPYQLLAQGWLLGGLWVGVGLAGLSAQGAPRKGIGG